MKTFPSYDHDLCDNDSCPKKGQCKRYLTYRKAMDENYPHPLWILVQKTNCKLFVKV